MGVKVSIIMSSFDRPHLLNLGLSSILKQNIEYDFEIIVVNDGCEDSTEEVCEKYFDKCQLKYYFAGSRNLKGNVIPRSPVFAQNIGIKKSTGDIVILTCPEIYHISPNGINNIITPLLFDKDYLTIPKLMYFDDSNEYTKNLLSNIETDKYRTRCTANSMSVEMPFLLGVWKKHLLYIGGYDEDLIGYASDDNDLIERLKLIGCSHHRVDATIVHLYHGPRCSGDFQWDNPDWVYNYQLSQKKMNPDNIFNQIEKIKRNIFKNWGKITENE